MTSQEEEQDLEQVYGPMASHSEHHRGDRVRYTSAEGRPASGTIIWVQAAIGEGSDGLGVTYIIEPDPGSVNFGFVDFARPADITGSDIF